MYRISPFTPVFFSPSADLHRVKPNGEQVFAQTDRILIEIIATDEDAAPPEIQVCDSLNGYVFTHSWKEWVMNDTTTLYFVELQGLDTSKYYVKIGERESEPFIITNDEAELQDTVLLQYSNSDNRQRNDVVFFIDGMQRFFDFRVPGGFKDDNWSFNVNNEQFVTSDNDRINLFGQESTIKTLTIGNSDGCPIWFADLVNRILCCNYVYVDQTRYVRNEGEVPEVNCEVEGQKAYIFTQGLQRVINLDPSLEDRNLLIMRRVDEDYRVNTIDEQVFNLIV